MAFHGMTLWRLIIRVKIKFGNYRGRRLVQYVALAIIIATIVG